MAASGEPSVPWAADPTSFVEAVAAFRRRVPMPKDEWEALEDAQHEYAFTVAGVAQADMVAQVWDAIDAALARGEDFDAFKDRVQGMLEGSWGGEIPGRLDTIFRTGVNQAYNAGRYEIFSAPAVKEARPYFRYELISDENLCDICEPCEDVVLPQDDPWWDEHMPPQHMNCRCSFTGLSEDEAADAGIDDEGPKGQDAADGFGDRPSEEGTDWAPTMGDYAKPIRDVLEDAID